MDFPRPLGAAANLARRVIVFDLSHSLSPVQFLPPKSFSPRPRAGIAQLDGLPGPCRRAVLRDLDADRAAWARMADGTTVEPDYTRTRGEDDGRRGRHCRTGRPCPLYGKRPPAAIGERGSSR